MISERTFYYTILLSTIFSLFVAFSPSPKSDFREASASTEILNYNFDVIETSKMNTNTKFPFLENSYIAFKEALAFKESQGKYTTVNSLGYLGKFQFGVSTLELLGIYNPKSFLTNPALQEKAFLANTRRNKWVLRRDIKRFVGKEIDGIEVTESGILAAAHLAGPGNVKRYLRSLGAEDFTDAYGTGIPYYMRKFSGFDTSFVTPHKKPNLTLL
jgi:hypothetical protein|tara:strand:- start:21659 stop:22303 length:645 start_codon:yes stop_codon:yes gene_type:complete